MWTVLCQWQGIFGIVSNLPMAVSPEQRAIYSPKKSRNISIYFKKQWIGDQIMARVWQNHGCIARIAHLSDPISAPISP